MPVGTHPFTCTDMVFMYYRRAPLSGSKVSLVAERFTVLCCHGQSRDLAHLAAAFLEATS